MAGQTIGELRLKLIFKIMAKNSKISLKRLEIPFFDGVNSLVASNISKKQEFSHVENARSKTIGSVEKREGSRRLGNTLTATGNYGIFFFENSTGTNSGFFRISKVSGTVNIYHLNTSAVWTVCTDGDGLGLTAADFSYVVAENCCFLVNGTDANRYISSDGNTVIAATTSTGHLYNSPIAYKINYFKDRLYVADYTVGSTRYKNGVMFSSVPLGVVCLVDGDHDAGVTTINVTDTKYIHGTDSLDVYRGNTKIETLTISAKTESTITVNATSNAINSADELWVANTFTGTKVFRWAGNPASGENVKQYDTFKLSGGKNDPINMFENIGDVMMIGNQKNIAVWNGYSLQNLDMGIGCISKKGYVKALGSLFFLDYTGVYATSGGAPRLISAKVDRYIQGASKSGLDGAVAGRKGLSIFFTIGDVTLYYPDGSTEKTLSDVCLEYNLRQENWYVHTGISATHMATYDKSDGVDRLIYADDGSGYPIFEIFRNGESLDDAVTSDIEIPMRLDTDYITLGSDFETICRPSELIIESERGNGTRVFVSLDGGQFYELEGEATKGCTIMKVTNKDIEDDKPPRCRRIKISLRNYTKQLCKITRIALLYFEGGEEEQEKLEQYGD